MSLFASILGPESFKSIGQSVRYLFRTVSMALTTRQRTASEDESWRVAAVVSAIMELFLSILLLLGATITFITSQLVKYFDLEPPCVQIGCSHTLPSRFTTRRHARYGRQNFFYDICPNCCSSLAFTKRCKKRSLHSVSSAFEGTSASLDNPSTPTSSKDLCHLDEKSSVSSDHKFGKKSRSSKGFENRKRPIKANLDDSGYIHVSEDHSQLVSEGHLSSMRSSSESSCSSEINVLDCCEVLAATRNIHRPVNCYHEKNHQNEVCTNEDLSIQSTLGDHYTLLMDKGEDKDEELYCDSFQDTSVCDKVNVHMVANNDTKFSELKESHYESLQPLLSFVTKSVSEGEDAFTKYLDCSHQPSPNFETANCKTCVQKDFAECKETTHAINACDGEHRYVLLDSDDRSACELQPSLLNCLLDDELGVPNYLSGAVNIGVLSDSSPSSTSKGGLFHKLDGRTGLQVTNLDEGQHHYCLLDNDDQDSTEAPRFENMLSDIVRPLLQNDQECESESSRPFLKAMCGDPDVTLCDSSGAKTEHLADFELPEAMVREVGVLPAESVSKVILSSNFGTCFQPSTCSRDSARDVTILDHLESKDHDGPLADLETFHSLRRRTNQDAGDCVFDMESGRTAFVDLLKAGVVEDVISYGCRDSQACDEGKALFTKNQVTDRQSQENFSEESSASHSEENRKSQISTGLCNSGLEAIVAYTNNLLPGSQVLPLDLDVGIATVCNSEPVLLVATQLVPQGNEDIQVNQDESVDYLRQALCMERTMLAALEIELDKERNAAAVATNEAMAMISRLQEEKSAMQLEVAQLQRMAEEKAEYDEQTMALLKEILFKREAEKHALEKEVELYRHKILSEKIRSEQKGSSMWPSSHMSISNRTDEDQELLFPGRHRGRLEELCMSEDIRHHLAFKDKNMFSGESGKQSAPICVNASPAENWKGTNANDRIDTGAVNDTQVLENLLIESSVPIRSAFSANCEESQFILERLWLLEEELRDLRGADGLAWADRSPACHESVLEVISSCPSGEAAESPGETGIGACLSVHDVYEVHSSPSQQDQHKVQISLKGGEGLEDLKETEATESGHNLQGAAHTKRPFSSKGSRNDITEVAPENGGSLPLKDTEGQLMPSDVVQQLASSLRVPESYQGILKEISEGLRHKHVELSLLQEIAQHLRGLQKIGFHSTSAGHSRQDPGSKALLQGCSRSMKKRRYCSDPCAADVVLLHQTSI